MGQRSGRGEGLGGSRGAGEMEGLERLRGTRPRLRSQSCSGQPSLPIQQVGLLQKTDSGGLVQVWAVILQALGAGLHGAGSGPWSRDGGSRVGDQQEGAGQAEAARGQAPRPRCTGQCCSRTRAGSSRCRPRPRNALARTGLGHRGSPPGRVHWGNGGTSVRPAPEPQPSLLPQQPLCLNPSMTWPLLPSTTIAPGACSDLFRMPRG